ASRASSRWATCAGATSNASPRRWARGPSPSLSFIRCCMSKQEKLPAEGACAQLGAIESVRKAKRRECEDCVKIGAAWVHLRTCQECRGTRCCDSSPTQHASN